MATLISAAITILVPILVALVLLILPKALMEKTRTSAGSDRPQARYEVTCVEIPEMLLRSGREYEVGRRS